MPGIPAPDSDHRPAWTARLMLGLAVVAVYANSLGVPFHLDDEVSILANESLHDLSDLRSVLWPRSEIFTAGRPLLNLTFALNYAWGGTSPAGYHVVNLAIHLAAVLVLAGLVRRTLLQPACGARFTGSARWIATGAALLWGLHPVLTESVTYVSQRAESLMGLCYFGTLYAVVRAAEAERPRRWSAVAVGVCVAGMLVKEVMVTAPVTTLVFDVAFLTGSLTESWRRRRGLYVGLAATWLVLAPCSPAPGSRIAASATVSTTRGSTTFGSNAVRCCITSGLPSFPIPWSSITAPRSRCPDSRLSCSRRGFSPPWPLRSPPVGAATAPRRFLVSGFS